MARVKVYNEKGNLAGFGAGLFAREFMRRFPLLPVEDEGRLQDPDLRENFIERVFALARYREAMAGRSRAAALVAFHSRSKLLILSHSEKHERAMGRLVATAGNVDPEKLRAEYERLLLEALRLLATPAKHTNVLQHIMGFFKKHIDSDEKRELAEVIEAYRAGLLPLIAPVTLLRHYARKYDVAYLRVQDYLDPHPLELKLRNHA